MPRVLVLAYHFPPLGGGGVQRNLGFVRHLPACGYEPVVLTGSGNASGRWTPSDPTLLEDVPPSVEIFRTAEPRPPARPAWERRLSRLLMTRTTFSREWEREVLALGAEVARDVDLVYASLVPYASAQAAPALASLLGKPWVADLQDPWALDEMYLYPSALHRRADLRRMQRLLASASAIVMNTPEAVARVRERLPGLDDVPVVAISNGFDPDLFARLEPIRPPRGRSFRIVHTGYLHTELGRDTRRTKWLRRLLGGMLIPIDIFTRSHVFLIHALDELARRAPELRSLIEVHLAGVASGTDEDVAKGVEGVRLHGYLSHADSVALLLTADLLFLPMHNLPDGARAGIVPGKTYEYLRSGRPILAAVPSGDARDLLERSGTAFVCGPDDVSAMSDVIEGCVRAWRQDSLPPANDLPIWRSYAQPALTAMLAKLFDQVLAKQAPSGPGGRVRRQRSTTAGFGDSAP